MRMALTRDARLLVRATRRLDADAQQSRGARDEVWACGPPVQQVGEAISLIRDGELSREAEGLDSITSQSGGILSCNVATLSRRVTVDFL